MEGSGRSGLYEVRVQTQGVLILPEPVMERAGLAAGDILSLEMGPASLYLEIYREFLGELPAHSTENRWLFLSEFLSRPLTAAGAGGAVPIPAEVFPLAPGEVVVLQVLRLGLVHKLYLFRSSSE